MKKGGRVIGGRRKSCSCAISKSCTNVGDGVIRKVVDWMGAATADLNARHTPADT